MSKKDNTITVNRMGIGGYVYACPETNELKILDKLPPNGTKIDCTCGKKHKVIQGRTKHFSHYL